VEIRHANGLVSGYAHLTRVAAGIRSGRGVKQGDVIGYVGQTGLATGPHLHFMILRGTTALDPRAVLKSAPAVPLQTKLKPEFKSSITAYLDAFSPG
jgi:murein DD-endopeptidase MepM/ murein hydrolase activator NlpD